MHGLQKRKVTGRNDTNSTNKLMAIGIIPYLCPKLHDAELLVITDLNYGIEDRTNFYKRDSCY